MFTKIFICIINFFKKDFSDLKEKPRLFAYYQKKVQSISHELLKYSQF